MVEELQEVLHLESRTHSRFWIPCLRNAGSELSVKLFMPAELWRGRWQTPDSSSAAALFWLCHVPELTEILVTEVLRDQPP